MSSGSEGIRRVETSDELEKSLKLRNRCSTLSHIYDLFSAEYQKKAGTWPSNLILVMHISIYRFIQKVKNASAFHIRTKHTKSGYFV